MNFATAPQYTPFEGGEASAIGAAAEWLTALLTGSLAAGLCVIAVALLGFLMFSGRMPVRTGLRTVLGCFVLLGAPIVASAFLQLADRSAVSAEPAPVTSGLQERVPLPQSTYDPYAGASLRQD